MTGQAEAEFDMAEATDLELHVRQETRRHRDVLSKLTSLLRLALLGIGLHFVTLIPGAWAFVAKVLGAP
jgi:hypothetical protein